MSQQPTEKTYRRLIQKIVTQINRLPPDANPELSKKLNKKFKKYLAKIETYGGSTGNKNN